MKKGLAGLVLGATLAVGALAWAGPNVGKHKHPNLAAAQKHIDEAVEKLTAAQKANEYDLGGHAAKAKDLLEQARAECKLAAEAANENK